MSVPRGHSPPMVGSQGQLATSLFLTSDLRPSSLGEVCLVCSLITRATLRSSAWRQQRFLSVFRNNKHGHARDGDGIYSGLGLAWILLPRSLSFYCTPILSSWQSNMQIFLSLLPISDPDTSKLLVAVSSFLCSIGSDNIQ